MIMCPYVILIEFESMLVCNIAVFYRLEVNNIYGYTVVLYYIFFLSRDMDVNRDVIML